MCRRISYRAGESEAEAETEELEEKAESRPATVWSDSDFFRDWFLCIILIAKICASKIKKESEAAERERGRERAGSARSVTNILFTQCKVILVRSTNINPSTLNTHAHADTHTQIQLHPRDTSYNCSGISYARVCVCVLGQTNKEGEMSKSSGSGSAGERGWRRRRGGGQPVKLQSFVRAQ